MLERGLRVRTRNPYPEVEGTVRLIAEPKPNGGFAVRPVFSAELTGTNPMSARSRTDPVFLVNDPEVGFQRATEWLEQHLDVLGDIDEAADAGD